MKLDDGEEVERLRVGGNEEKEERMEKEEREGRNNWIIMRGGKGEEKKGMRCKREDLRDGEKDVIIIIMSERDEFRSEGDEEGKMEKGELEREGWREGKGFVRRSGDKVVEDRRRVGIEWKKC